MFERKYLTHKLGGFSSFSTVGHINSVFANQLILGSVARPARAALTGILTFDLPSEAHICIWHFGGDGTLLYHNTHAKSQTNFSKSEKRAYNKIV